MAPKTATAKKADETPKITEDQKALVKTVAELLKSHSATLCPDGKLNTVLIRAALTEAFGADAVNKAFAEIRRESLPDGFIARASQKWEEDWVDATAEYAGKALGIIAICELVGRFTGYKKLQVGTALVRKLHSMLSGTDDVVELPD